MAKKKTASPDRLDLIEVRLVRLEKMLLNSHESRETPVEPWKHLVRRQHPWRKQLYLKARNLTARQLVGGIKANELDEAKAAANYKLPAEAIHEALAYVAQNNALLEAEAEIERLMLRRGGVARGPQPVP